ncbi:MAG: hypothetical protein K9G67_03685 [Bacteroidales bacterium]|nr:hypothetical protein [Bacteroidales bacterium]MCF8352490.1 hypothetical protein [Bacteroidales bacterium]MCF8375431.1 hypothetical protein [Bacteroidales bacterium]MCF8400979.1 hypothetical protein [Bacteroidales bacterium]
MKREVYTPRRSYSERYNLTRHPRRIRSSDVIEGVFNDIDYYDCPDPSLVAAKAKINGLECIVLGQEKKREGKESKATGMITAKGYAYALKVLEEAEANQMPVVSFIDTFGGDSSMESELGGQSFLISDCISKFCSIKTPTISFVIGEGGSGGALAMQVTDKGFMLENALYSVIAPESCSRIIFHKRLVGGEEIEDTIPDALEMLRPGAEHILQIGMIDEILPEPEDGAHTDYERTIKTLKEKLIEGLEEWVKFRKSGGGRIKKSMLARILKDRRRKVLNYGEFVDTLDELAKRKTRRNHPENVKMIDIEREDFHNLFQIKAHLEHEGIEDTELYDCEKEWDPDKNLFRVAGGCGFVSYHDYIDNYYACPKCGKGEYLCVDEQIEKICDPDTFMEIEGDLTIDKMINNDRYNFGRYKATLEKLRQKSFSKEGLVTGNAKLNGKDIVLVISDLKFIGGSFGAVYGERFRRAVQYAVKHNYPLISVCSSGGARMNEGPMSLAQMAKMNMALLDLKRKGLLYISVITGPTTGGAYASYVTQGDVIVGEKGALVEFAGPRVVMGAGFDVDREIVCTDNLYANGKIHDLVNRKDLKDSLSYHVNLFYAMKFPENREKLGRVVDFNS